MKASSDATLKAILDSTGAGTWELNIGTGAVVVNDRWTQMLGYEPAELGPISIALWERLSHPDDIVFAKSLLMDVIGGRAEIYDCVVRMWHKDGGWRFIRTRGTLSESEEASWVIGIHLDITNEKKAQYQITKLAESRPIWLSTAGTGFLFH